MRTTQAQEDQLIQQVTDCIERAPLLVGGSPATALVYATIAHASATMLVAQQLSLIQRFGAGEGGAQ